MKKCVFLLFVFTMLTTIGFSQTCLCGAPLSTTVCRTVSQTTNVNQTLPAGTTRSGSINMSTSANTTRSQTCSVSNITTVFTISQSGLLGGVTVGLNINTSLTGSNVSTNNSGTLAISIGNATTTITRTQTITATDSASLANTSVNWSITKTGITLGTLTLVSVTSSYNYCYAVCPLSADLISFTGKSTPNKNMLTWVTDNEFENDKFVVQKWTENGFETIGEVKAKSEVSNTYTYSDTRLFGQSSIYKIITVEKDGDWIESEGNTITIENSIEERKITAVYDLIGNKVTENFSGPCIYYYEDGTTSLGYK